MQRTTRTLITLATTLAIAGAGVSQSRRCGALNERGGSQSNRTELWEIAWEVPMGTGFLDSISIYTRSRDARARTILVNIYLPDSTGGPSSTPARRVPIVIGSGTHARFYTGDLNRISPNGPLLVRGKFFLGMPGGRLVYWPALDDGTGVAFNFRRSGTGAWTRQNFTTYPAYKYCYRTNYVGGAFTRFGSGCRGSRGVVNHTATNSQYGNRPELNSTSRYNMSGGALPVGGSIFFLGFSRTQWGPIRLPLDLTAFGAPGCRLYVSPDIMVFAPIDSRGNSSVPVRHPNDPRLINARIYTQFLSFDRAANSFGYTYSNAIETRIGGTK